MTSRLKVHLDISANPPVTVSEKCKSIKKANEKIQWTPARNSQTFTFENVHFFDKSNPFPARDKVIECCKITQTDRYRGKPNGYGSGEWEYVLYVTRDRKTYTSIEKHRRRKAKKAEDSGPGGGGGPKIKNT